MVVLHNVKEERKLEMFPSSSVTVGFDSSCGDESHYCPGFSFSGGREGGNGGMRKTTQLSKVLLMELLLALLQFSFIKRKKEGLGKWLHRLKGCHLSVMT